MRTATTKRIKLEGLKVEFLRRTMHGAPKELEPAAIPFSLTA